MAGLLSKGITLSYRNDDGEFVTLPNLQEIAEIGNNAREKIDVTTLSDDEKKNIAGLGDTAQDLPFKFLYDKAEFEAVTALKDSKMWLVTLPDGMKAYFTATPSVKLAGVGVSAPLTYTLMLSVESKIEWGEPPAIYVTFHISDYGAYEAEGGTYKVKAGTTWEQFVATVHPSMSVQGDAESLYYNDTGYTTNKMDGTYIALNGKNVKPTDVIIATTYEWN